MKKSNSSEKCEYLLILAFYSREQGKYSVIGYMCVRRETYFKADADKCLSSTLSVGSPTES